MGSAPEEDIAALSSIPTTRSTFGNELLTSEGYTTVATITGFDEDLGSIDKHLPGWRNWQG